MNKNKRWLIAAVVFMLSLLILFVTDAGFIANFIAYMCLFIIAGHGWNLLGGYVGEISFGHAVFFGLGAYTVGLPIGYGYNFPVLLTVLVGGVVAALFALIISVPLLRVKGFPFLVGTYGLGFVILTIFINTPQLFATRGIFIPSFNSDLLYALIYLVAIVTTLFIGWLVEQSIGLQFKAVRDVPVAAQMIGINIYKTKATALVIGAFLVGISGGLFAVYSSFVNPHSSFGFGTSLAILLGPYIGGVGTILGPVLGGAIVIILQEYTRSLITISGGHHLALGLLLVVVMMTNKEGVYPAIIKLVNKLKYNQKLIPGIKKVTNIFKKV